MFKGTRVLWLFLSSFFWTSDPTLLAGDPPSLHAAIERFSRGEFAEAKQHFEKVLAIDATNAAAKLYLGRIALEEGRLDPGVKLLEQAAKLSPTNAVCVLWLARGYGLQAKKAGVPGGLRPALRMKATFEKAIALDPNLIEAREALVLFHLEAPGIVGGSRKVARSQAGEIQKRDPYTGALMHGDLLKDERKWREAENHYQSAAEMKPRDPDAHYRLGKLYLETKAFDKAFSAFEKILLMDTNEVTACYYLGKTGALSGQQLARAEEALRIYLRSRPRFYKPSLAAAHVCLGQVHLRKGDRERAREQFQQALKLDPDLKEAKAELRKLR